MASVDLRAVALNLASDPSDYVMLYTVTSLSPTKDARTSVRTLANGRQRVVRQAGTPRSYSLKVEQIDRATVAWLEGHVGDLVCVRDDRGRKFYAIFSSVPIDESTLWQDKGDVSLSLSEVSHSEAV